MATFWSASGPVCAGETSYGRLRPGSIFSHRPLPWRGPASAPRPLKEACPLAFWPVACSALGLHLGPCAFSACCVSALQTHAASVRDAIWTLCRLICPVPPTVQSWLKCEKMVLWLRGLLLRHWRQRSDAPPPPRLLSLRHILLNARCSRGGVNWAPIPNCAVSRVITAPAVLTSPSVCIPGMMSCRCSAFNGRS